MRFKSSVAFIAALMASLAVQAQNISGTWSGKLDLQSIRLTIVFHFDKDSLGRDVCFMDSPDQSAKGIPTVINHLSADSVNIDIRMIGAKYSGTLAQGIIKGTFSQMGMNFPLELKPGAKTYRRPQTPQEPFPYETREVTFDNPQAPATLSGTLTYPVGYRQGDKVPVALMVSGSGLQDRNSEIFEHKTFLVIADYLARHGIATLRYDDRGGYKSTGTAPAANTAQVAEDAACGIEFLRSLGIFSKVGIIGHSEGGTVAFMLGAKGSIDFAVSMAGVGINGLELLYTQSKDIMEASGKPFTTTKEQLKATIQAMNNPWFDYFLEYDPSEDIRKIQCPLLALNGDKDLQVSASANIGAIRDNLPKEATAVTKVYSGLNHLFQECSSGLPTEYVSIEQTISPQVLADIAQWIASI